MSKARHFRCGTGHPSQWRPGPGDGRRAYHPQHQTQAISALSPRLV